MVPYAHPQGRGEHNIENIERFLENDQIQQEQMISQALAGIDNEFWYEMN